MGSCSQRLTASERLVQGLRQWHFALGPVLSPAELWDMKGRQSPFFAWDKRWHVCQGVCR